MFMFLEYWDFSLTHKITDDLIKVNNQSEKLDVSHICVDKCLKQLVYVIETGFMGCL